MHAKSPLCFSLIIWDYNWLERDDRGGFYETRQPNKEPNNSGILLSQCNVDILFRMWTLLSNDIKRHLYSVAPQSLATQEVCQRVRSCCPWQNIVWQTCTCSAFECKPNSHTWTLTSRYKHSFQSQKHGTKAKTSAQLCLSFDKQEDSEETDKQEQSFYSSEPENTTKLVEKKHSSLITCFKI